MKSEPGAYSIDDLARDGREPWDGVRNYQARNFMRDDMKVGDWVLFYHSNAKPTGVVGVATVGREAHPDPTQFVKGHDHEDPKSDPKDPRWCMVEVAYEETFPQVVTLEMLKEDAKLEGMLVRQKGQRLSVQPVEEKHFRRVVTLGKGKTRL